MPKDHFKRERENRSRQTHQFENLNQQVRRRASFPNLISQSKPTNEIGILIIIDHKKHDKKDARKRLEYAICDLVEKMNMEVLGYENYDV